VTTRTHPRQLFSGLLASLHEGGHALYDQGYLDTDARTTLAQEPSLGMHESQSRMWENLIGRSLPFWKHYAPLLRETFPGQLDSVSTEQIYHAINCVRPSLIRVEADECTYNLHIILRYEIEVDLLEGRIGARAVPEAWNAKVKQYLGIDVPDDAHGCLQDVHWSHGAFGYFPTYALGNLYAAQLFEAALRDIPDLWERIGAGEFLSLREWLRENIHRHGRRKTARQFLRDITGAEPYSEPYLKYLEGKFGAIYGI
jgi:carboxypeptidase Taq